MLNSFSTHSLTLTLFFGLSSNINVCCFRFRGNESTILGSCTAPTNIQEAYVSVNYSDTFRLLEQSNFACTVSKCCAVTNITGCANNV